MSPPHGEPQSDIAQRHGIITLHATAPGDNIALYYTLNGKKSTSASGYAT